MKVTFLYEQVQIISAVKQYDHMWRKSNKRKLFCNKIRKDRPLNFLNLIGLMLYIILTIFGYCHGDSLSKITPNM